MIIILKDIPNLTTINAPSLIISTESDCEKISSSRYIAWGSITVKNGLCSSIVGDIVIANYPFLQAITVEDYAFGSLYLINSLGLESIINETC